MEFVKINGEIIIIIIYFIFKIVVVYFDSSGVLLPLIRIKVMFSCS